LLKSLFLQDAQQCPDTNLIEGGTLQVKRGWNEFTTCYSLLSTPRSEGNLAMTG
jgi:hypothetical protein